MRSRPLTGYLLLTFLPAWLWFWLALGVWGLPFQGPVAVVAKLVGPALAAVVMTALVAGRPGLGELLRRCVRWRVAPVWYLVALAGWPAPTVAALLAWPGAAAALTAPAAGFAATYAGTFLLILVFGGPLGEEPGWRGFALPLLQQRVGPLAGALVVGALHALWHLPIHLLVPSHRGLPGFVLLVAGVIALSVVSCWIFNNTRGSLLIAMLHHATTNSAVVVLVATFPAFAIMPALDVVRPLLHAGVALLLVAATRGRLCYERYRRETGEIRQR